MFNNYYEKRVREICHGVKLRDSVAIKEMALYLLNLEVVTVNSILVPAPQHEGRAIYTKEIADIIAEQTGSKVLDVLKSKPRVSLYEQKLKNKKDSLRFYLEHEIDEKDMFFVDNVIDTGMTYREANRLLKGKLRPLVYATVRR